MSEVRCFVCPELVNEVKDLVQCTQCAGTFHATCVGVTDLKAFRLKRATWMCPKCIPDPSRVKRLRKNSGESVLVDRNIFQDLLDTIQFMGASIEDLKKEVLEVRKDNVTLLEKLSTIEDLGTSVEWMKKEINEIRNENKILIDKLSAEQKSVNKQVFSYANATSNKQGRQNSTPAELRRRRTTQLDPNSPCNAAEQAGSAVREALENLNDNVDPNSDGFRTVSSRRSRFRKPVFIGESVAHEQSEAANKFEGTERRHWVYLGRVKSSTTAESIIDYVKAKWNLTDVQCVPLVTRDDISSFKVAVRESHIPSLLHATFVNLSISQGGVAHSNRRKTRIFKKQQIKTWRPKTA